MGITFSHVQDIGERTKLQNLYTYAILALILNLLFIFIPSLWLYWIPYSGHWILLGFSIIRAAVSMINYRFSSQYLPASISGISLTKVQLFMALFLVLFTLVGAILQELNRSYLYCYDDYYNDSYCYEYYTYFAPALAMLGIAVPILAFIHMVIFSVNCSQLWNEAIAKAIKAQAQQMIALTTIQGVNTQYQAPVYDPYAQVPQFQQFQNYQLQHYPGQIYPSAHTADPGLHQPPQYVSAPPQAMVNVQLSQDQWAALQRLMASQSEAHPKQMRI